MDLKHKYKISMLGSDSIKELGLSKDKLKITIDGLVSKMDENPSYCSGLVFAIKSKFNKNNWKYYTRKHSDDEPQAVKMILDKIRSDVPESDVYLMASVKKIDSDLNTITKENNKLKNTLDGINQLINPKSKPVYEN